MGQFPTHLPPVPQHIAENLLNELSDRFRLWRFFDTQCLFNEIPDFRFLVLITLDNLLKG